MLNKRIFITGASGLVGSHITRLLIARGFENIVALRRKGSAMDLVADVHDKIEWVDGDVTDAAVIHEVMEGVDWVIHAAAIISYQKKLFESMHAVNVDGTANIVNASVYHGVEKLVHISSMAVFTRNGGVQQVSESTPWEPTKYTSEYGLTKHLAEMEVWRGKAEGLKVSMLLPTIVMGSGFWKQGSSSMFYKSAKGIPFHPVGSTGFIDVRDLALLAVRSLEQENAPERMIANGSNHTLKYVMNKIAILAGKTPSKAGLPQWAGEILWRLLLPTEWLTGNEPLLSKSAARTTVCKQTFDNALSLTLENFDYTSVDQSIEDVMDNYAVAVKKNLCPIPMSFLPHHLT